MKGKVLGMKKWCGYVTLFVLAVLVVAMLDVFSTVSMAATGKTTKNAKIRKSADANSTQLGLAEAGTSVEITGETKGNDGKVWYQVTVNGISGYIRSDLIDASGSDSTGDAGNAGNTTTVDGLEQLVPVSATVTGGNTVRIRTSASTKDSNNILTTAANGTNVTVVARTTGSDKKLWYQIKLIVNEKEVLGYIRYDYLTISGEVKPFTEESSTPAEQQTGPEENQQTDVTPQNTEVVTPTKRYDTKLMNDKWYLLDYEANKQYDIDEVFSTAKEFEDNYTKEVAKTKKLKTWLTVFILLTVAGFGIAGYLFYQSKTADQDMIFKSMDEEERRRRVADRPVRNGNRGGNPQNGGKDRPVIKEGLEPRREDAGRPVQNGQRTTGGRAQGGARQDGSSAQGRLNGAQGARMQGAGQQGNPRMNDAQRVSGAAQGNPRQGMAPQGQNGGRPMNQGQQQNGSRANVPQDQGRRVQNGQPQQRPNNAQPNTQAQQNTANRSKNFVQDNDQEFEFLNWDSDDE